MYSFIALVVILTLFFVHIINGIKYLMCFNGSPKINFETVNYHNAEAVVLLHYKSKQKSNLCLFC